MSFIGTYIEEMYRNGVDVMNIEGTQLADAIVNRAVTGIASDVVRLAWGGDGATANYNAFDGWMKLMGADATVLAAQNSANRCSNNCNSYCSTRNRTFKKMLRWRTSSTSTSTSR